MPEDGGLEILSGRLGGRTNRRVNKWPMWRSSTSFALGRIMYSKSSASRQVVQLGDMVWTVALKGQMGQLFAAEFDENGDRRLASLERMVEKHGL